LIKAGNFHLKKVDPSAIPPKPATGPTHLDLIKQGVKLKKINNPTNADETSPKGKVEKELNDLRGEMNHLKGNSDGEQKKKLEAAIEECQKEINRLQEEIKTNATLDDANFQKISDNIKAAKKKLDEAAVKASQTEDVTNQDLLGKLAAVRDAVWKDSSDGESSEKSESTAW
jgi:seryl-tRNA synthetase